MKPFNIYAALACLLPLLAVAASDLAGSEFPRGDFDLSDAAGSIAGIQQR